MEDFESIHPEDDEIEENGKYGLKKPSIIPTFIFSLITIALLALAITSSVVGWPMLATGLLSGGTCLSYLITSGIYSHYSGKKKFYELKKMHRKFKINDKNKENKKEKETEEELKEGLEEYIDDEEKTKKNNKYNEKEDDKETTFEEEDEETEVNNKNSKYSKDKINEKKREVKTK